MSLSNRTNDATRRGWWETTGPVVPRYLAVLAAMALVCSAPAQPGSGQRPRVGETFPEFWGHDQDNKVVRLSDFRGKVLLVDFWATWCPPCREELPQIKALHAKYGRFGFDVLGVSLDRSKADLQRWYASPGTRLPYPSIFDEGQALSRAFGIDSIPAPFLVDEYGRVIAVDVRGAGLQRAVGAAVNPNGIKLFLEMRLKSPDARDNAALDAQILNAATSNPTSLNNAIWYFLEHRDVDRPAAAVMLSLMERAPEMASVPFSLDTMALAAFRAGDVAKAVAHQEKVLERVIGGRPLSTAIVDSEVAHLATRMALFYATAGERTKAAEIGDLLWKTHGAGTPVRASRYFAELTAAFEGGAAAIAAASTDPSSAPPPDDSPRG